MSVVHPNGRKESFGAIGGEACGLCRDGPQEADELSVRGKGFS